MRRFQISTGPRKDRVEVLGSGDGEIGLGRRGAVVEERGSILLAVTSRRVVHGARLSFPGYEPDDNCFSLEPATTRTPKYWRP